MAEALPQGYAKHFANGVQLLVPQSVASQLDEERRAARKLEAVLQSAPAPKARTQATEEERARRRAAKALKRGPAPGFHRVLPRFAELVALGADDEARERASSDSDVRRRRELTHKRLLELGPDRRIGQPGDWSAAMDELEQAMPNFREPIRIVRNALAMAAAAPAGVRAPPLLLLGPPGVGKTYFSQRLAKLLGVPHAVIAFDQPSAGSQLRGSDKYWSNTEAGMLFNLLCLGEVANPVILLDELDKAAWSREMDPLAQLHAVLEPQTACCVQDISTEVEIDASLVAYVATANSLRGIGVPLLSRFEIFEIPPPSIDESIEIARHVVQATLERLGLHERVRFERRCVYILARMSPRLMRRAVERLAAAAVHEGRAQVTEDAVWNELGVRTGARLH